MVVCFGMTGKKAHNVSECNIPIVEWLVVYGFIFFISFLRRVLLLILLYRFENYEGKRDKIEKVYCCFIFNFEIAWLIYGNTFMYSTDGMTCK